jgi:hypothetical protein
VVTSVLWFLIAHCNQVIGLLGVVCAAAAVPGSQFAQLELLLHVKGGGVSLDSLQLAVAEVSGTSKAGPHGCSAAQPVHLAASCSAAVDS